LIPKVFGLGVVNMAAVTEQMNASKEEKNSEETCEELAGFIPGGFVEFCPEEWRFGGNFWDLADF
jgi:hypothetical protein